MVAGCSHVVIVHHVCGRVRGGVGGHILSDCDNVLFACHLCSDVFIVVVEW